MALSNCPNCDRLIDIDGFAEHGEPTIFYCECGKIYDMPTFGKLTEVPREEVDLSGLSEAFQKGHCGNRGLFIKKTRWKKKDTQSQNSAI